MRRLSIGDGPEEEPAAPDQERLPGGLRGKLWNICAAAVRHNLYY
jgi:hypothetical protein